MRVLLIEDNEDDAYLVQETLNERQEPRCDLEWTDRLRRGLKRLAEGRFDVVLLDLSLPDSQGLETFDRLQAQAHGVPLVVLTGLDDEAMAVQAVRKGAQDYLVKGRLVPDLLVRALRYAVERKQVEAALRLSEARLAEAQRMAHIGNWEWDLLTNRVWCSDETYRIFGLHPTGVEMTYDDFLTYVHPDDRGGVRTVIETATRDRQPYEHEYRIVRPDGTERTVRGHGETRLDDTGRPVRVVGTIQDITEKKQAEKALQESEAQLRQAQKMESIGRLAGGIAHDFNNLLTVINSYSAMLLGDIDFDSPLRKGIEQIKEAGHRAALLTRQLLAFSRQQVLEPKVLDLNAVVSTSSKLLRRLIGEDIELVICADPSLGRVKADPGQIEQVIMNLAVNARDAMPKGGQLTIETRNIELGEASPLKPASVEPGRYVMLAVSDTGCGMDAETQARIFEPFFTTKELGKGTGLGLSMVYGIVKQSGGYIWVSSELGKGTSFTIYLPQVDDPSELLEPAPVPDLAGRGSETILLVEDDEMVRVLTRTILQMRGYTLLEARNAKEAIHLAEEHNEPIHLLLTDTVMPGLSGPELAERVASARPDMKVLYMSGYTDKVIALNAGRDLRTVFLQKPFTPEALARKVREVLDSPGPRAA
ncbi:MAG TPA: response regulator [Nitrospiraceae bacterium]|jgi:PAS domain S-box-containing protein|nr:response regulator [Nitrospiraceae bacterium]